MNGIDVKMLLDEYKIPDDIFEIDDEMLELWNKLYDKLEPSEQIILLLYSEMQSYRKCAKLLGISYTLLYKEVKRIKEKLLC